MTIKDIELRFVERIEDDPALFGLEGWRRKILQSRKLVELRYKEVQYREEHIAEVWVVDESWTEWQDVPMQS
jgi:hypothetical protein